VSHPRRRVLVASALATALALVVPACSDDEPAADEGSAISTVADAGTADPDGSSSVTSLGFPPNDVAALKGVFDPMLESFGLRLTRGALVDRSDGYEFSDTGTHLALYVEPIDDDEYTIDRYVENIYDLTAAITPAVFAYGDVETYDICQEPHQEDDDGFEPFPVTQVELTRQNYEDFAWDDGDLASFLAFLDEAEGTKLIANPDVQDAPSYLDAVDEAGADPSR
jgi:hypothetical protein